MIAPKVPKEYHATFSQLYEDIETEKLYLEHHSVNKAVEYVYATSAYNSFMGYNCSKFKLEFIYE